MHTDGGHIDETMNATSQRVVKAMPSSKFGKNRVSASREEKQCNVKSVGAA